MKKIKEHVVEEDLTWLFDLEAPLIIADRTWRDKQRQLRNLPRWYYEPLPHVAEYFAYIRGEGPPPDVEGDDLWTDIMEHIERDVVAFVWFFCYYKNRDTRRRELATPTAPQLAVLWRTAHIIASDKPVRIDLLKERQGGFSWLIGCIMLWMVGTHPDVNAVTVAHDKGAAQRIFQYLREGHEKLPDQIRPAKQYSGKSELVLREPKEERRRAGYPGLESSVVVDTAGNNFVGTGLPLQGGHISEIGKWHVVCDPEVVYTSLVNSIQDQPGTYVFRESTAHGADTFWHREWKASCRIGGEGWNGHTPIFVAWYFDERNRKKAPADMELCSSAQDEFGNEVALKAEFDLDNDQLEWRRRSIIKQPDSRSKVDMFNQEHPGTPEVAWLYASGKWLEPEVLAAIAMRIEDEIKDHTLKELFVGDMQALREKGVDLPHRCRSADGVWLKGDGNEWLRRRRGGPLRIFRWPDWHYDYIAGCDVAENVVGGDSSCVKIYQRIAGPRDGDRIMRLAAEWYGLCDDDALADILWRLGHFYSTGSGSNALPCMLVWERTGSGRGVAKWLRLGARGRDAADSYPPSRMYRRHEIDKPGFFVDQHYGVSTNSATKPVMMAELKKAAREGQVQLLPEDLAEMQTVTRNDRGLIETQGRDRLMAATMAIYGSLFSVPIFGVEDKKEKVVARHSVAWALQRGEESRTSDEL